MLISLAKINDNRIYRASNYSTMQLHKISVDRLFQEHSVWRVAVICVCQGSVEHTSASSLIKFAGCGTWLSRIPSPQEKKSFWRLLLCHTADQMKTILVFVMLLSVYSCSGRYFTAGRFFRYNPRECCLLTPTELSI